MRAIVLLGLCLVLGMSRLHVGSIVSLPQSGPNNEIIDPLVPPLVITNVVDTSSDDRAQFHPHGEQVCASGCAASRHPTEELTEPKFRQLVERLNNGDRLNSAIDSLVYFGPQSVAMLDRLPAIINPDLEQRLREQLSITHAKISIRVVDENGDTRSWLPPTRVPFDRRHEFEMETNNLQPHITSGTVKRVGTDRLWTRL